MIEVADNDKRVDPKIYDKRSVILFPWIGFLNIKVMVKAYTSEQTFCLPTVFEY